MSPKIAGVDVSRETMHDLRAFEALVKKWTPKINLISKASIPDLWDRHILDSLQLFPLAPLQFQRWVDIGSGGGFPGIVMAILGRTMQPDANFILIESDQRKATFLRTAARELNLKVDVLTDRIEAAPPQCADVVSARALTALSGLLPLVNRHLSADGTALLHKGQQYRSEILDVHRTWTFELTEHQSITDVNARLLSLQRIRHEPKTNA